MQTAIIRRMFLTCLVLAAPTYSEVGTTYHACTLDTMQLCSSVCICQPV